MGLVKQGFASAVKRQEQQDLRGIDQVVDRLKDRLVESQPKTGDQTQRCRSTEDGKDAEYGAEREGQRDLLRRDALPELRENRLDDATAPERHQDFRCCTHAGRRSSKFSTFAPAGSFNSCSST